MRRRQFIAMLGGVAVARPHAARAQRPGMPVIGFLGAGSLEPLRDQVAALYRGLKETGFIEGQNVTIEYRWAEGQYDRLPRLAAELVQRQVTLIVTTGGSASALAAKAATATIPIVFTSGIDPIETGLVASLNRPGGNVTGVSFLAGVLEAKRLELLHEVVPNVGVIALLVNPNTPRAEAQLRDAQEAAARLGIRLIVLNASNEPEIDVPILTQDAIRSDMAQRRAASTTSCAGCSTPASTATRSPMPASCGWRRPGLGMFVVYLGHALDSSNLCPGSSKIGLVLLIRNLLSTQWPAYYFCGCMAGASAASDWWIMSRFRRNLDAFDLAHTGRLASLRRFGNPLMRAEH
jgi:hypothetical protein